MNDMDSVAENIATLVGTAPRRQLLATLKKQGGDDMARHRRRGRGELLFEHCPEVAFAYSDSVQHLDRIGEQCSHTTG